MCKVSIKDFFVQVIQRILSIMICSELQKMIDTLFLAEPEAFRRIEDESTSNRRPLKQSLSLSCQRNTVFVEHIRGKQVPKKGEYIVIRSSCQLRIIHILDTG